MKFLTRKLITPADLNPRGTLHGGQLLKWIDEEGGIHACLELDTGLIVTKYISEIETEIKRFVAIASGKGGVGKSTTTANLAVSLKLFIHS